MSFMGIKLDNNQSDTSEIIEQVEDKITNERE